MRFAVPLLLSLLAVCGFMGCSDAHSVDEAVQASADLSPAEKSRTQAAPGAQDGPEATVGKASAGEAVGSLAGRFVADREASGGSGYHADTVLAVRYGLHEGYERVVVDLGTGDEPARRVPRWTLSGAGGAGLLRVTLPSASATRVSDGGLGDRLMRDFYVVRAPEGGLFVDFFARSAFLYRVMEMGDPARLVVDFKPTGAPLEVPLPAEGGDTVLVEPRPGGRISDPLIVGGYSRSFEATNTVALTDATGEVVARRTVLSNDWSSTWGYFEATLDLPPFSGEATLRVGANSARDGSFRGVEIPVQAN